MEHISAALARAFNIAPPNDEAPNSPQVQGPDFSQHTQPDSRTADGNCKAFATLSAQLALRGYSLHELSDETFFITRWNLSRHVADLQAVARFARQIGGAA